MTDIIKAVRYGICGILLVLFGIQAGWAGSLNEDYRAQVEKRQELESQRGRYEDQLKKLGARRNRLTLSLYQCVSKDPDKDYWDKRLEETKKMIETLEKKRADLIQFRLDLGKVRREMEIERQQVEKKHQEIGASFDYEGAFREYMKNLDQQYLNPIETELFDRYRTYLSAVESYLDSLEALVEECKGRRE